MYSKKSKQFLSFLLILSSLVFFSCRSTQIESDVSMVPGEQLGIDANDKVFCIYENEEFENPVTDSKYVFIRLYQPCYDNPFCIENVLKNCIASVDITSEISSHSAISLSLNDQFYGLTTSDPKHNLSLESCTFTNGNKYMSKCNRYKSVQITYALKVSEVEYERIALFLEDYYSNPKTKYNAGQNFKIAGKGIKRKLFMQKDKKQFACHADKTPEATFVANKTDFVCSTFIAYILANTVDSIRDFFIEKQIDSNFVVPSDLAYLPGVVKLFKSTWIDYSIGARFYADSYSCLAPYYTNYIVSELK